MKKFLFLSLILLCTAMGAWSETPYTTESVTLTDKITDISTGIATDPQYWHLCESYLP